MCPDHQIFSLYLDKELQSPWKEKLEAHLESCPDCRTALQSLKDLGNLLHGENHQEEDSFMEAAKERVWNKLAVAEARGRNKRIRSFWSRSVSLPLPAAAAAAAAVLIFTVFLTFRGADPVIQQQQEPEPVAVLSDHVQIYLDDAIPIQDMISILEYLSSQGSGDVTVIQLPSDRRFDRAGEPALINAADYTRRFPSR